MDVVDLMLQYEKNRDFKLLITSDLKIDHQRLTVIVINILSWLKLEHKRTIWISEGKKTCLKPMPLNNTYPWCADLCALVEKEALFRDYFSVSDGKFDFADSVSETDRKIAREKAYNNYNPPRHVLYRGERVKLNRAGFFRELGHGDENGMSLREAVRNSPSKYEDKIIEYLDSGVAYCITAGLVSDVLDESRGIIGSLEILTDGAWTWPSDLSYYVKYYHVELDTEFIIHMKENGWTIPYKEDLVQLVQAVSKYSTDQEKERWIIR